jgi:hypothetical protein
MRIKKGIDFFKKVRLVNSIGIIVNDTWDNLDKNLKIFEELVFGTRNSFEDIIHQKQLSQSL